jgi:nucleoid-associated protein YgaU
MNALSRHAQASSDHAALPFHPGCPSCVARRALGNTEPAPLVSRGVATGAVALALLGSGGVPTVVVAQAPAPGEIEGDSEGTGDADSPGDLVPPNVDLDGDGTAQTLEDSPELPDTAGPEGDIPDAPDTAEDPAPVAPPTTSPTGRTGDETPAPAGQTPEPAPDVRPVEQATTINSPPGEVSPKKPVIYARKLGRSASSAPRPLRPLPEAAAPVGRKPTPQHVAKTSTSLKRARAGSRPAVSGTSTGGHTHTVHAGDTLWGIAAAQLGPGGASPARVAAEVTRLWNQNQSRIGTGDPDLIRVGTVLQLG